MMRSFEPGPPVDLGTSPPRHLTQQQIEMIEEALAAISEFGELRLVVEKGRLRFLVIQTSYDALKWYPGMIK